MLIPKSPSESQLAFAKAYIRTGDWNLSCAVAGIERADRYAYLESSSARQAMREAQNLMIETVLKPQAWRVIAKQLDIAEAVEGSLNRQQQDLVRFVAGQGAALSLADKSHVEGVSGADMTREQLQALAKRSEVMLAELRKASGDAAKTIDGASQAVDNTGE